MTDAKKTKGELADELAAAKRQLEGLRARDAKHLRTEEELREQQRAYHTLLANLNGMAYRCRNDRAWTMEIVSDGCLELTGFAPTELQYSRKVSWNSVVHPDDRQSLWEDRRDKLAQKEAGQDEYRIIRQDGQERWVWDQWRATFGPSGDVLSIEGFVTDITEWKENEAERRRLQERLKQSQKLEALGQLAGGVAHDFNNLLTAILGNAETLWTLVKERQDNPPIDALSSGLEQIVLAGERATSLTRQLLTFSRKQHFEPRVIQLNSIIAGMQEMLRRLINVQIRLDVDLAPGIGNILADAGQLELVVMNLVLNARDAMPGGGVLTIATADAAGQPGGDRESPRQVVLMISDTGSGMDEETKARIFEPFFTTKESGKGTGLGMSTVNDIVTQLGGRILVESRPGLGTTFRVYLPAVDGDVVHDEPESTATDGGGSEVILVCEDESMVRDMVCEILRSNGYTALPSENGQRALEVAAAHAGRIDLLLSDVVMPGIGGLELAQTLKRDHPGIRAVFVSGYSADIVKSEDFVKPDQRFLQKPFSPRALLQVIREVLGKSNAR